MISETEASKMMVQSAARSHLFGYWSRQFTFMFAVVGIFISWGVYVLDHQTGQDVFRYITLAMGVYLLGFSFKLMRIYRLVESVATGTAKYLPSSIKWISFSYFGLVAIACGWIIYRIGHSWIIWGTPTTFMFFLAGIYGLGVAWRYELRRAAEHGLWEERRKIR